MRIGELAKAVGVPTSTIRYYEQVGLLEHARRTSSGYRDYTTEDERRLRLVVQARMLSVPLTDIQELVDLALEGRCSSARGELLPVLRARLAETRQQIHELRALERQLKSMCDELVAETARSRSPSSDEECGCLGSPTSSTRAQRKEPPMKRRPEGGAR